ncbi:hypothetical protein [Natronospira bacteriovora]|uniref:Alginate export domain-containing protein n=1 Tax=Natronospira bacteriovora TaxID=3069753 RepID=A0ABU0W8W1_9GAMM|nr:hypothetical protein [Natronospira sp. AB-CW4]MDQ2070474.1 hypothetical protein [Natronospira sp. AB-CW4]
MKCANCHVNPAGGGMRNTYGNIWAQNSLPARQIETREGPWTGMLNAYAAIGANLRANAVYDEIPNQESGFAFEHEETRLYLQLSPLPDRLEIYIDQRMGPGGSSNQEAFGRYRLANREWHVTAGQMYLPYGLRLEDDSAFVRQTPGINFNTPQAAVSVGWEPRRWSIQSTVSEGSDARRGKQLSLRAEHVRERWRAGGSLNSNHGDDGTRWMQNAFAGLRTGSIAWLAEINHIRDDNLADDTLRQWLGLVEANWLVRQGHNLKLTLEYLDPDVDARGNDRNRYSLVWECAPIPFVQLRLGARLHDGPSEIDLHNRSRYFLQFHSFF